MSRCLYVVLIGLLNTVSASAGVLNDFNLIAFGNVTGGGHVDGRSIVYGDIAGKYQVFGSKLHSGDGLVLGGELKGNINVDGGGMRYGVDALGGKVQNADYVTRDSSGVEKLLSQAKDEIGQAMTYFESLTVNGKVELAKDMNNARFYIEKNLEKDGVAVFDVDAKFFSRQNGIASLSDDLKKDGNLFVFRGYDSEITIKQGFNLEAGGEFGNDSFRNRIVWYFPNAKTVNLYSGFGGSLFAPNANINFTSNISGTVVANNINLGAEIHLPTLILPPFPIVKPIVPSSGDVPEPATIVSIGMILCVAIVGVYRRRVKHAKLASAK